MRFKVTQKQINDILDDPQKAKEAGIKVTDPWWVIALKVIAYLIGLILGGATTSLFALAFLVQ